MPEKQRIAKLLEKYEADEDEKETESKEAGEKPTSKKVGKEKLEEKETIKAEERLGGKGRAEKTLKEENIKLDLKDRRILYELDLNARQSSSEIAKKVKLSKDTINYRIKRMEKLGVIQGYYAILDASKLGYISFRVYIRYFEITPQKEEEIVNHLVKEKNVGWVAKKEGNHDLAFMFWAKDIYEFADFWQKFTEKFRPYFYENYIGIWAKLHHYRRAYLLNLKQDLSKTEIMGGSKEIAKFDKTDWEILRLIAPNARVSLVEMAKKLNLSERAVAYRIKQLEQKEIILGYRALLDIGKLGYNYFKVDIKLRDGKKIKELMEIARINPNIIYVNEMISGMADFEFDIQIQGKEELNRLIQELKEKFKDAIRNFEFSATLKEYKLLYLPVA